MPKLISLIAVLLAFVPSAPAETTVSFQRDVAPILQRRCVNCHSEENPKGGYRLDTFELLLKAGDSGAAPVEAGKAHASEIHRLLVTKDSDERMPQKADALPAEELSLIERWMNKGAAFDGADVHRPLAELVRDVHLRPAPVHYGRPMPVTALAFSPDGRRLASSGYREVLLWNTAESTLSLRVGGMPERISSLAWDRHRNLLAIAGGTPGQWGTIAIVDVANDYRVRFLCDLPDLVLSIAFSHDGNSLVAGCGDRTLRLFDASTWKSTRVMRVHADWVQAVAFNPSGTRLATASRDRTARVLDTSNWQQIASYQGHESAVLAAAFSFDGSRVITTAGRGVAQWWNPENASKQGELAELGGDTRQIASGSFGVIAGSADGVLRLYQAGSKQPWLALEGHRDSIHALALTRAGDLLASGSADGDVIIWSPACWAPVGRFTAIP